MATVECANINACSSSVSENKGTMELVNIRQRAQNLLCDVVQNGSNNSTIDMLLSITSETNSVINTTTPLQPIDIPTVLDILRTVLKYVYVHTLAS